MVSVLNENVGLPFTFIWTIDFGDEEFCGWKTNLWFLSSLLLTTSLFILAFGSCKCVPLEITLTSFELPLTLTLTLVCVVLFNLLADVNVVVVIVDESFILWIPLIISPNVFLTTDSFIANFGSFSFLSFEFLCLSLGIKLSWVTWWWWLWLVLLLIILAAGVLLVDVDVVVVKPWYNCVNGTIIGGRIVVVEEDKLIIFWEILVVDVGGKRIVDDGDGEEEVEMGIDDGNTIGGLVEDDIGFDSVN